MRPLEHYPVAALLVVVASLAMLRASRAGSSPLTAVLAGAASLAAVEMSLLLGFPLGVLFVSLVASRPHARRGLLIVGGVVAGLFFASTFLGFWGVLADTRESTAEIVGVSIGWTNALLFAPLLLLLVPKVRRRAPEAAPTALAVVGFTVVVLVLQKLKYADGAPYPNSYRYFSMIDPLLVLAAVFAVRGAWDAMTSPGMRRTIATGAVALLASQALAYADGERHIFLEEHGFSRFARPWRSPGLGPVAFDPADSIDILKFTDDRKNCMREACKPLLEPLRVEGRGLLTGDPAPLNALRGCLEMSCPEQ